MTKVCVFCEKWGSGGIESFLLSVMEHLDRSRTELILVTAKIESPLYLPRLRELGVGVTELSGDVRALRQNHRKFRALLAELRFDAVHINTYHALSWLYARDAQKAGVPVIIAHSHNTRLRPGPGRGAKTLLHRACRGAFARCATDLWACSRAAAEFMFPAETVRSGRVRFVPNGIDLRRFAPDSPAGEALRRECAPAGETVFCHVGRLCPQKNQSFLLDVFSEICKRENDAVLLLAGDGEDESALRQKAETLGIAGQVRFLGAEKAVERVYQASDVFLFPSRFEGLGIALLEAQAAGLPAVCSDQVPPEACVTDRVFRLPLEAGPAAWAERALACRDLLRRSGAAELAARGFSAEAVAAGIQRAYSGQSLPGGDFSPFDRTEVRSWDI